MKDNYISCFCESKLKIAFAIIPSLMKVFFTNIATKHFYRVSYQFEILSYKSIWDTLKKLQCITHSWHPNHQNFVIYECVFKRNFVYFFFQLLKTSFNIFVCWLIRNLFSQQKVNIKKIWQLIFHKKIFVNYKYFGGSDVTNAVMSPHLKF